MRSIWCLSQCFWKNQKRDFRWGRQFFLCNVSAQVSSQSEDLSLEQSDATARQPSGPKVRIFSDEIGEYTKYGYSYARWMYNKYMYVYDLSKKKNRTLYDLSQLQANAVAVCNREKTAK